MLLLQEQRSLWFPNTAGAKGLMILNLPTFYSNYNPLAIEVWSYFNGIFNIYWPRFFSFHSWLALQFNHGIVGSMENMCYTITSMPIVWDIWKKRCGRRFQSVNLRPSQVIKRVNHWVVYITGSFKQKKRYIVISSSKV